MDSSLILSDDGKVIKGIKDKSVDCVSIPYGITSIGNMAFKGCTSLRSIDIPNSVVSIGSEAFSGCRRLAYVAIPETVSFIDEYAFYETPFDEDLLDGNEIIYLGRCLYCLGFYAEVTDVVIKDGTVSISPYAFEWQHSLKSIIIPNSVTSIGKSAFAFCDSLSTIIIPNSVVNIGEEAFVGTKWLNNQPEGLLYINNILIKMIGNLPIVGIREGTINIPTSTFEGRTNLKKIYIPNGVISIGNCAFKGCTSLNEVEIPNSVSVIGNSAFKDCKSLHNVDIPNSVNSIGDAAFCDCNSLQSIDIPNSVNYIGECAFLWCFSLHSINIPFGLKSIKNGTFQQCSSLEVVNIPNSVTSIGSAAFARCESLKSIILPNSVKSIEKEAFSGCLSLQNVHIPEGVISIGQEAFRWTLLEKILIPSTVEFIGNDAFGDAPNLSEFIVENDNNHFMSYEGVLYKCNLGVDNTHKLLKYPPQKALSKFTVNDNTKEIDSYAFKWARNLEEIVLHDEILDLGVEQTFSYCESLKEIHVPSKITSLPKMCFRGCKALEHVYILDREQFRIEKKAFMGCDSLNSVHFRIEKPENIVVVDDAFDEDTFNTCTIFIPSGTRWAYRHHPILGKFKNIVIEQKQTGI